MSLLPPVPFQHERHSLDLRCNVPGAVLQRVTYFIYLNDGRPDFDLLLPCILLNSSAINPAISLRISSDVPSSQEDASAIRMPSVAIGPSAEALNVIQVSQQRNLTLFAEWSTFAVQNARCSFPMIAILDHSLNKLSGNHVTSLNRIGGEMQGLEGDFDACAQAKSLLPSY